jgi:hypothetical protein
METFEAKSEVWLEAGHICIRKELAEFIFGRSEAILSHYYPKEGLFLAAAADEPVYASLSRMKRHVLKTSSRGDRWIPVQELLAEHGVVSDDRNLSFVEDEPMHMLKIKL